MCPRCAAGGSRRLAVGTGAVWEVRQCETCLYTWRTTEPARRTERASYPEEFKMTRADMDAAPEVPAVPPLRTAR